MLRAQHTPAAAAATSAASRVLLLLHHTGSSVAPNPWPATRDFSLWSSCRWPPSSSVQSNSNTSPTNRTTSRHVTSCSSSRFRQLHIPHTEKSNCMPLGEQRSTAKLRSVESMANFADGYITPTSDVAGSPERAESSSSEECEWSDEDADESLARALAANAYLQGSSAFPDAGCPASASFANEGTAAVEGRSVKKGGTILIHHPACELHDVPGHPERPGRVRAIMNAVLRKFPDIPTSLAPEAKIEQVVRFHTRSHVDGIIRLCDKSEGRERANKETRKAKEREEDAGASPGANDPLSASTGTAGCIMMVDSDTAITPGSREAVFRAAGAACFAVDEVMSGHAVNAFCCVRPPGHHAEPDRAMGFCLFNNAPIGALHAQAEHGVERVAVVDIDVHHGNGTQAFFKKDPTTFYASTHQGPDFYPCTGYDRIKGVASNVVNVSMGDGEGSEPFRRAYSQKIFPALEAFRPGVIVISAGFDAHKDDPLAGIVLDAEDYRWVTREICAVAHRVCEGRVVSILEGGYNLRAISESAVAHVDALREASALTPSPESTTSAVSAAAAVAVTPEAGPAPATTTTPAAAAAAVAPVEPEQTPKVSADDGTLDELAESLATTLKI